MNRTVLFVGVIIIAAVVGVLFVGLGKNPSEIHSPLIGKPAPEFALREVGTSQTVDLTQFRGKPLVVNFWATWCGPCKVEMPWFEEFRKKYAADGFEVLGVADDSDAGKDVISGAAKKLGVTYPILLADNTMEKAYGDPEVLPMSFYVDRNGIVVEETAGLGPKDQIEAHIKKAIASGGGATAAGGQ